MSVELNDSECDILVELLVSGSTPTGLVSDLTGRHKTTVSRSMASLEDLGLVRSRGYGSWMLTVDGVRMARALIEERREYDDVDLGHSL